MDGNLINYLFLKVRSQVKIRPLMDGNQLVGLNGLSDIVKIRPLMDGNSFIAFNTVEKCNPLKSDH